ncbi:hypothetical protein [Bacilliculturomica massiliensis]|uniref:hypothetical protein n=1 Tax=Bacilliculturomica massiliensis TaxID=1917867 RepID=UPI00102FABB0|nr:hypothetical protein [Bacilliculturomica massiliensis]
MNYTNTKEAATAIRENGIIDQINKALDELGVHEPDVRVIPVELGHHETTDRYKVYLGNKFFGIWDSVRKTFVD